MTEPMSQQLRHEVDKMRERMAEIIAEQTLRFLVRAGVHLPERARRKVAEAVYEAIIEDYYL